VGEGIGHSYSAEKERRGKVLVSGSFVKKKMRLGLWLSKRDDNCFFHGEKENPGLKD